MRGRVAALDGLRGVAVGERWRVALWRGWLALVLASFAALSLPRLSAGSLFDEDESLRLSTTGAGEALDTLAERDVILVPYYLLARAWLLPAESMAWLRVLSLLAAVGVLYVTAQVGRREFGRVGGAVAVAVLALHPMTADRAVDARPYALATLAVVLVAWVPRRRWVPGVAAVLLHLFAALPVLAILAAQRRWRDARIVAAVTAPLAVVGFVQRGQVSWIGKATREGDLTVTLDVLAWWLAGTVLVGILAGAGAMVARRGWLLAWAVAPGLALYLATQVHPILAPRYVTFSTPAVALLVGALGAAAASQLGRELPIPGARRGGEEHDRPVSAERP